MKSSKKYIEQVARALYKKSLTAANLDEKKVHTILKELSFKKPAGLSSILKAYKRLVANKYRHEEIVIETNDKIIPQKSFVENLKKKTGARRVVTRTNPEIIFGAKIYHGDWIFDDTLSGKLEQLKGNL